MNAITDTLRALRPTGRTLRLWRLTLEEAQAPTPKVRRLRFSAPDLAEMAWGPGQDLVLDLPHAPRRHYTIRQLAGGLLDIDFVLHGEGPAAAWAASARPGARIEAYGPRGRVRLVPGADWRLFVGDDTCVPAISAMLEALAPDAPAWAFLEVQTEAEIQPIVSPGQARVKWVVRGGPARPNDLLLDEVRRFAPPPGIGHACLIGETSGVRAQRQLLIARGWASERIAAEGYWRPGRAGGHDHV